MAEVYLSARNGGDIEWKFRPESFRLSSYSLVTTSLQIKVSENASARPYNIPLIANASFPSEQLEPLIESLPSEESGSIMPKNSENIIKQFPLIIEVLPPLTMEEQIRLFFINYSIFVSFVPLIITTFVTVILSKVIDIKKSPAIKSLGVVDILTIDATVIAGVLVS